MEDFIFSILEWFMLASIIVAFLLQIIGAIGWVVKKLRPAEPIPNSVLFSWRDENGYLKWTLSKPDGTTIDLSNNPEEAKRQVRNGAIWMPDFHPIDLYHNEKPKAQISNQGKQERRELDD